VLRTHSPRIAALALALAGAAACGGRTPDTGVMDASGTTSPTSSTSSSTTMVATTEAPTTTAAPAPSTTARPAAAPTTPKPTVSPTTSSTRPHPARHVTQQQWAPYATAGPLTLRLPADRVEAIGFHQSGHDGAVEQTALPSSPRWFVMADRERDTKARGAADIVVEPGREIRVPVSGTVKRAGTYTLYCDSKDQYAVIDPDGHPGWEVKILHIEGLVLSKGQRVEAGVTKVAAHARVLPFASQVEEDTGLPPWPHVHIEVVDPSVPDRPGKPCP
jgi:hypothetical protein